MTRIPMPIMYFYVYIGIIYESGNQGVKVGMMVLISPSSSCSGNLCFHLPTLGLKVSSLVKPV